MQRGRAGWVGASGFRETHSGSDGAAGYLASPTEGSGPGVLVYPPRAGLDAGARAVCDRLAREGFVALALDWLAGPALEHAVVDAAQVHADALLGQPGVLGARVGCVGVGAGVGAALAAARGCERIAAVACIDPASVALPESLPRSDVRVHFVATSPDESELVEALRGAVAALTLDLRADARPGFFDEGRVETFDPLAADRVWSDVIAFLRAA